MFDNYVKKGFLKHQSVNFKQIEKQMVRAKKDIETANHVIDYDPEWGTTIAYQAMLRAGRALIFSNGYLPSDGQQHKTVVEITNILLGKEYALLVEKFERMRRNRNTFFYESDPFGTLTDAKLSIEAASQLILAIQKLIQKGNPQTHLNL